MHALEGCYKGSTKGWKGSSAVNMKTISPSFDFSFLWDSAGAKLIEVQDKTEDVRRRHSTKNDVVIIETLPDAQCCAEHSGDDGKKHRCLHSRMRRGNR